MKASNAGPSAVDPSEEQSATPYSAIDYLANVDGREVAKSRRIEITKGCRDADYIPKVDNAGKVLEANGKKYQLMHNGIKVAVDGYYGDWVTNLIKDLKGHHEPQEEKVFHEVSKLFRPNTAMIELGSYWAFYSLWFHQAVPGARNICCEPDPENLKIGRNNFELNGFGNVEFVDAAAGSEDGKMISFDAEHVDQLVTVPIRTVDSLVGEFKLEQVEVLHMDVQGAEFEALKGAEKTIKTGKLRFIFISTHHYLISRDPNIHQKCIDYIEQLGGHIICEHDIHESYSGDGLIVASFLPADKKLTVDVSRNRMAGNQFRAYTKDLELVFGAYEKQLERIHEKNIALQDLPVLSAKVEQMQKDIDHLNNLNIRLSTRQLMKSVYRSLRFRTLKLIWGSEGRYKNSNQIEELAGSEIKSADEAKKAVAAIVEADRANTKLIFRSSPLRKFIFEALRSLAIGLKKIIRGGGRHG